MSITTYSELQTALQNWIGDSTFSTDRAKECIGLAEARINRKLRLLEMETQTDLSISTEYTNLPANFGGIRGRPQITSTDPTRVLEYMTSANIETLWMASETRRPVAYTIEGSDGAGTSQIRVRPAPDTTYTVAITYYLKVPALSDSNTTNWFLTENEDLYLFGSLSEVEGLHGNHEFMGVWKSKFTEGLEEMKMIDRKQRWSGAPLRQDTDVTKV